jgi:hypothetical protein
MNVKAADAAALPARPRRSALPRLRIASGSLEALKWIALLLMAGDHVNKYLLHASVPAIFDAGRIVMPVFAVVLGYNLARPGTLERGAYGRVLQRLGLIAAVATVPFVALGGLGWGWWPLNVMAAFWVAAASMCLLERGGAGRITGAALLLLVGGLFVEYWWAVLAIAMAAWSYTRRPNWLALFVGLAGLGSLHLVNRNWWAFAALPMIGLASAVDLRVPRFRWAFYVFYPLHLAVIWALRSLMS